MFFGEWHIWKTNIIVIDNPIEKLESINGYYYNWKKGKDESLQVGVIEQEVEEVLPEIVSTDDGYKSVDYSKLTPLLIEAVKQQQQTIKSLIERIEVLEGK
ncbi:MAG: tail fiber domain-containing protein [Bacteroidota bacterium]